ncbi:hypothetical protein V8C86DRAFT_2527894 [Haematococcus lacustris]
MDTAQLAQVASAVQTLWASLGKTGKPQDHECTVLAGIAVTRNSPDGTCHGPWVVALGSGTKVLGGSKRDGAGRLVHDSHAEVIARRAFVAWLHSEIRAVWQLKRQEQQEFGQKVQAHSHSNGSLISPHFTGEALQLGPHILQVVPGSPSLALAPGVALHMYVSQAPCGDASILELELEVGPSGLQMQIETGLAQTTGATGLGELRFRTGAKALRLSPGAALQTQAAWMLDEDSRAGEGEGPGGQGQVLGAVCQPRPQAQPVPQAGDVEPGPQLLGAVRRKPGKGDATLSVSCSDKLARWTCLGLQGAGLSGLLAAPIYLSSLVVSATPGQWAAGSQAASMALTRSLSRALNTRLLAQGVVQECLQPPFKHQPLQVAVVGPAPQHLGLYPCQQRKVSTGASLNWSAPPGCCPAGRGPQPRVSEGLMEVTQAASGCKSGATKAALRAGKAMSRLCRAALQAALQDTLAEYDRAVEQALGKTACAELNLAGGKWDNQQEAMRTQPGGPEVAALGQSQREGLETERLLPNTDNKAKDNSGRPLNARDDVHGANEMQFAQSSSCQAGLASRPGDIRSTNGKLYCHTWARLRASGGLFTCWIDKPDRVT